MHFVKSGRAKSQAACGLVPGARTASDWPNLKRRPIRGHNMNVTCPVRSKTILPLTREMPLCRGIGTLAKSNVLFLRDGLDHRLDGTGKVPIGADHPHGIELD